MLSQERRRIKGKAKRTAKGTERGHGLEGKGLEGKEMGKDGKRRERAGKGVQHDTFLLL